jgi:TorA maturation chaperone TorD
MELFRALAVLVEPPERPGAARVAEALGLGDLPETSAYTEVFVFKLYPYASVYLGAEGMLGGEARDRVSGFLAALGRVTVPREPDHLALMLATYAGLSESEELEEDAKRREYLRTARRAFLWEHLLSWLPVYIDKLERIAPPFYRRWAEMLRAALDAEAVSLGRQDALALHLREAPKLADPRASSSEEFLRTLLAPVRCGMILVRDDLARAAHELGTGVRAGERLFALRSLAGQDTAGTLGWLANEADAWKSLHLRRREAHGQVAEWWAARAASTAKLLRELMTEADAALRNSLTCSE